MKGEKSVLPGDKQTIIQHLEALRKSLISITITIIIAASACFYVNEQLITIIMKPLSSLGENLIVTGVTEAFFVKLKVSFCAGIVVAFPVIMWSVWGFIKPALYPQERKFIYWLLPISMFLFAAGILFAYFVVLKLVLGFFILMAGQNMETMFKVDQYVSFILAFTLPFGILFELPVVTYFLSRFGIISHAFLSENRRYAILVIVVLSALLTPGGDPISMILMAVPVYILFEISVLVSRITEKKNKQLDMQMI
jgi:sec-independent protein translocase protein TatC